jgi:hypothetical protein
MCSFQRFSFKRSLSIRPNRNEVGVERSAQRGNAIRWQSCLVKGLRLVTVGNRIVALHDLPGVRWDAVASFGRAKPAIHNPLGTASPDARACHLHDGYPLPTQIQRNWPRIGCFRTTRGAGFLTDTRILPARNWKLDGASRSIPDGSRANLKLSPDQIHNHAVEKVLPTSGFCWDRY